jgi:hypothetical protein
MASAPLIARDAVIRLVAFDHIRGMQSRDLVLSHENIDRGFMFEGRRWPLWNRQRGIFKPRRSGRPGLAPHRDPDADRQGSLGQGWRTAGLLNQALGD